MKEYKSKIGIEFILLFALILGGFSLQMILNEFWVGLFIVLLVIGFIGYLFASTKYIIEGDKLVVKDGFSTNIKIEIDKIKKITETYSILSSPAASIDRLEILYNKFDSVLISPKDKSGFIANLCKINPTIEVVLKKK